MVSNCNFVCMRCIRSHLLYNFTLFTAHILITSTNMPQNNVFRPCDMLFCTYRYYGIADGDETAFASSLALQAYFEGREIGRENIEKCLEYWRANISEMGDPTKNKRQVMCEPFAIPFPSCACLYRRMCQMKRVIPFAGDDAKSEELKEIYDKYESDRQRQIERYEKFKGPVQNSSFCRCLGCRRVFGRKGVCFCTEGCNDTAGCCYKDLNAHPGDPFVPFAHPDIDDDNDAAKVLQNVLGDPPSNVVYKRWERDEDTGKFKVVVQSGTKKGRKELPQASEDGLEGTAIEETALEDKSASGTLINRYFSGRTEQSSEKPNQLTGESISSSSKAK